MPLLTPMNELPPVKNKDILADILNARHDGKIRGLDELNDLIHAVPDISAPGNKKGGVISKPVVKRKVKSRKKKIKHKTTHYLTEDVFSELGEAKKTIKNFLPEGSKSKATKSGIVESAVKVLLEEFELKGEKSYLVQELLKKK